MKETFDMVITPLVQTAVPHFPDDSQFVAFAIEVSHHVKQKVMGVVEERPENVTIIIPVLAAQKLVDAKSADLKTVRHYGIGRPPTEIVLPASIEG
jgi:hypothetical protein